MNHAAIARLIASMMPLIAGFALAGLPRQANAQAPIGGGAPPFSTMYRRPSLSPYTALGFQGGNPMTGATLGAMQSAMQPQMQQQAQIRAAMQQARQISQLQRQVRQVQRPMGGTLTQTIRATGHASTFMELSHFYPMAK